MNQIFEKITNWFHELFEEKIMSQKLLTGIIFFILLSFLLTVDLIPREFNFEPGERSSTDITAPRSATFVDEARTEELKRIAAESAQKVYIKDDQVNNNVIEETGDFFNIIRKNKQDFDQLTTDKNDSEVEEINKEGFSNNNSDNMDRQEVIDNIQERKDINSESIEIFLNTELSELDDIQETANNIINELYQDWILEEEIEDIEKDLEDKVRNYNLSIEHQIALTDLLKNIMRPNMFLDQEETEQRKQEAMSRVQPYRYTVNRGEVVVGKGEIITEEDIRILEELGLTKPQINFLNILGIILIILILIILVSFYLWKYENEIWKDNKKLLLIELLIIIVIIFAKIVNMFQTPYLVYLTPVALVPILITILIKKEHIAFITTVFISLVIPLMYNPSFDLALLGFAGGIVGIFSVSKLTQRSDLVRAGFNVSGVLLIMIAGLNFIQPAENLHDLVRSGSVGIINGVVVAILANGFLPYLENAFGMASSVKLLELSNPSHSLLKRLLVEAPGTYHHSVIVGNLAETAADNIGADSLLARVAAYYHDIGKLKRPYFFIDNQFGAKNPHHDISANLSSIIIKSHVKDGVELAEKENLPEPIIDILKQHHGQNLISYFYQQAMEEEKYEMIEETDFCYDGPKPQTKEAAIIMLADVVEAAIRSKQFDKSDHNRIEALVKELIKSRLMDDQLEESNLTLRELNIIGDSFVKVLTGIYHQRIEYPEKLKEEINEVDINGESQN